MHDTTRAAIAQVIARLWPKDGRGATAQVEDDCKHILMLIAAGHEVEIVSGAVLIRA